MKFTADVTLPKQKEKERRSRTGHRHRFEREPENLPIFSRIIASARVIRVKRETCVSLEKRREKRILHLAALHPSKTSF